MIKNLIFISLDTVRADVAYNGAFKGVQNLRHLGVTFLNTISSSPLTPVSHATVFTGLQPFNHNVRHLFKEKIKKDVPTLADVLHAQGYKTCAIVSCPGLNRWYGFAKGFDCYDDNIPPLPDGTDPLKTVDVSKRGLAMKRANIVFQKGVDWISKNKEHPFFIFLHFFDAHWPYQAPEKFGGNNAYEEEVAYSAHYLDLLLEKLEEMNLLESTSVICFSDHGEDLNGLYPNDKGGKELGHPEESGHGCLLYEQTQKVVLILKDLSLPQNVNFMDQVRLVDIMPTTLELMGIEYNKEKFDGVSLLPIIQHGVKLNLLGYSETFYPDELLDSQTQIINIKNKKSFVIDNKHKIILHLESDNVEYYDIENDPNETKNLFSAIVR